jgi:hypothetical protein
MDYDTWKTTDPRGDITEECSDCGEPCSSRFHAPDYTPGYHPGRVGPVVCANCHESYDPRIP